MKKVTDYMLIEENSVINLEGSVKQAILKGYTPIGGVCVTFSPTEGMKCFQAVVKYED